MCSAAEDVLLTCHSSKVRTHTYSYTVGFLSHLMHLLFAKTNQHNGQFALWLRTTYLCYASDKSNKYLTPPPWQRCKTSSILASVALPTAVSHTYLHAIYEGCYFYMELSLTSFCRAVKTDSCQLNFKVFSLKSIWSYHIPKILTWVLTKISYYKK